MYFFSLKITLFHYAILIPKGNVFHFNTKTCRENIVCQAILSKKLHVKNSTVLLIIFIAKFILWTERENNEKNQRLRVRKQQIISDMNLWSYFMPIAKIISGSTSPRIRLFPIPGNYNIYADFTSNEHFMSNGTLEYGSIWKPYTFARKFLLLFIIQTTYSIFFVNYIHYYAKYGIKFAPCQSLFAQKITLKFSYSEWTISCWYGRFRSCLYFNSNAVISVSGDSQCDIKIYRLILGWDETARGQ
jgi:hypothetical protein